MLGELLWVHGYYPKEDTPQKYSQKITLHFPFKTQALKLSKFTEGFLILWHMCQGGIV